MIIGFAGRMKSGKGVLTNELVRQGYIKLAFADFLKTTVANLYNTDLAPFTSQEGKAEILSTPFIWNNDIATKLFNALNINYLYPIENQTFFTRREALQYIGTDVLRKHDNNFHINKTLTNLDHSKNYVCEDFRYQNELDALNNISSSKSYYIIRPAIFHYSNHISETSLNWSNTSNVLINDETEQDLINKFNSNYRPITYDCNNFSFLTVNLDIAFYAGFLFKNFSFELNNNKVSIIVKNNNYNNMKMLAKYLNYNKSIKVDNYKFCITIDNPYIIENLKRWDYFSNSSNTVLPDILQDNQEFISQFTKGFEL